MNRRRCLLTFGAVVSGGMAGCTAEPEQLATDDDGGGGSGSDSKDSFEEETTPSDGTATAAERRPGSREKVTGQSFVVNDVEYVVRGLFRAEELGSAADQVTADGLFVVAVVSVTNQRSEPISYPATHLRIRSPNTWQYPEDRPSVVADDDERIKLDAWSGQSVASGNERVGVAVFDVSPDTEWALWFLPIDGDGDGVSVPFGEPTELDFLQGVITE